jgi:hypothetical protein
MLCASHADHVLRGQKEEYKEAAAETCVRSQGSIERYLDREGNLDAMAARFNSRRSLQ